MEYLWLNKTVPMINKKYCKIRVKFNAAARGEFFGTFDTCFLMLPDDLNDSNSN